jgi:hypothetical protein
VLKTIPLVAVSNLFSTVEIRWSGRRSLGGCKQHAVLGGVCYSSHSNFLIIDLYASRLMYSFTRISVDCWCIPGGNGTDPCPLYSPQTTFAEDTVNTYLQQRPSSIYTLSCNPYKDATCTTSPAQVYLNVSTAVCGLVYPIDGTTGTTSCSTYDIRTFSSREEAFSENAVITHEGSCGLCSTAQDLALYLKTDFTDAGKKCATKGLFNEQQGLQCYQDIGLSLECAKIWNYDGIYDGKVCGATCAGSLSEPNNGPPPACEINACLECDEELAGPLFSQFAGRTRRRSGLLSEIVRDCDSIARIDVYDPCASNAACGC